MAADSLIGPTCTCIQVRIDLHELLHISLGVHCKGSFIGDHGDDSKGDDEAMGDSAGKFEW